MAMAMAMAMAMDTPPHLDGHDDVVQIPKSVEALLGDDVAGYRRTCRQKRRKLAVVCKFSFIG